MSYSSHFLRRAFPEASPLFVPAASPGLVFRTLEREAAQPAFARLSAVSELSAQSKLAEPIVAQLSGPPVFDASRPWRVLRFAPDTAAYAQRVAPLLSHAVGGRVFLLHTSFAGVAPYTFTVWENGEIIAQTSGEKTTPTFWSRLLPRANTGERGMFAWAEKHGLPLRRLSLELKRKRRIVDYDAVAGLERKGLFVENEPVWYRFALEQNVERENDIIKP